MTRKILVLAVVSAAASALAVTEWPLEKLTVSAYYMNKNVCTPERIREMRECGIDLLIPGRNGETNTFDLLRANGINTVVRGFVPGTGGDLDRGATLARRRPLNVYDSAAKTFVAHPVVTGIDIGDEPPAGDMPYLGLVAERVSALFPGRFPYLNLYPNYASLVEVGADKARSQLGTATYGEYIDEYVKWLPLNYICYDFYYPTVYRGRRDRLMRQYYANFEMVANAARRTGRHMCTILLVGSRPAKNPVYTRENELRFQAYTAMAYGASMIGWACYGGGWWTNWVVDVNGRTSEQYAKLKRVNEEIHRIAPVYDTLRRVDTHFVGFSSVTNDYLAMCATKDVARLDTGYFTELAAETPEPLVVGEFTGRTPKDPVHALFIVGAGDPFDEAPRKFTVRFKSAYPVKAYCKDGPLAVTRGEDGALRVALAPNEFAFVVTEGRQIDFSPNMTQPKFLVGAFRGLNEKCKSERYVQWLADAGIDFIASKILVPGKCQAELDLLAKYGIGSIAHVQPYWSGGNGGNAGQMRKLRPMDGYDKWIAEMKAFRHPAMWMVDICDEPSALDMPYLAEVAARFNREVPFASAYVNLYPNYAMVSWNKGGEVRGQLGTDTYAEHIDAYCRTQPLHYITYDHYPYNDDPSVSVGRRMPRMYENFKVVADACRRTGRVFWYAPQVNTKPKNVKRLSAENFRFQAFTSMAYGAEALIWATWTHCWWTNSVITTEGEKSDHFEKLKRVNAEAHRIGTDYMRFRNVDTALVGFKGEDWLRLKKVGIESPVFFNNGYFTGVCTEDGSPLVVGDMVARDPKARQRAIFVFAAGDMMGTRGANHTVRFRAAGNVVAVKGVDGDIPLIGNGPDRQRRFVLRDNRAALVILQN